MKKEPAAVPLLLLMGAALLAPGCGGSAVSENPSPPEKKVVLVTGATGRQGGAVARELLRRGWAVRALTRNPEQEKARRLAALGADVVRGDFDEPPSLDAALAGAYGVFSIQDYWEHGFEGEVRQGRTLADRAAAAGVRHFVYTSVASADRSTGISHFDSKWAIEEHLRASGLPYTILRPVSFMENWEGLRGPIGEGALALPLSPETRLQHITVEDIGTFAAEAFDHPDRWIGREIDIAGDDHTVAEVVEIFSGVMGRPVRYERVPWERFRERAGQDITTMYRWFERVGYDVDVEALRREFPFLTDLETYLRKKGWSPTPPAR